MSSTWVYNQVAIPTIRDHDWSSLVPSIGKAKPSGIHLTITMALSTMWLNLLLAVAALSGSAVAAPQDFTASAALTSGFTQNDINSGKALAELNKRATAAVKARLSTQNGAACNWQNVKIRQEWYVKFDSPRAFAILAGCLHYLTSQAYLAPRNETELYQRREMRSVQTQSLHRRQCHPGLQVPLRRLHCRPLEPDLDNPSHRKSCISHRDLYPDLWTS